VANAKVTFPSHSGIAYFVEVSPKNNIHHLYVLNVCTALLDNLYICDGCDRDGVPDLMRSSMKHTEEHHLIRCLAPEKTDDKNQASPTEQRLISIEGHLNDMQTQLDDLTGRMGDLTGRVGDLTDRMGDLTVSVGDLNASFGNIEQLLHRLVGAP
jgi:hypothetical protein